MYQFLDEQDIRSLVEKNPKETDVLEKRKIKHKLPLYCIKHNTKISL
jgi:hypothetical protein